jgi:MFS family permease
MPVVLAMAIGSPLVGQLLDRLGSKVIILAGSLILTAGMFLLSQFAANLALFILSGALIGLGLSALLGAPTRYITLNEVALSERSVAQGVVAIFASIGQLVGSALVGAVANSFGGGLSGYSAAFLGISAVSLVLAAAGIGLKTRTAERAALPQPEAVLGTKF